MRPNLWRSPSRSGCGTAAHCCAQGKTRKLVQVRGLLGSYWFFVLGRTTIHIFFWWWHSNVESSETTKSIDLALLIRVFYLVFRRESTWSQPFTFLYGESQSFHISVTVWCTKIHCISTWRKGMLHLVTCNVWINRLSLAKILIKLLKGLSTNSLFIYAFCFKKKLHS